VEPARAGSGALVLLAGEAGIGKTRLATEAAAALAERGVRVVWGRCWEAGGAPAYFPWSQVFDALAIDDPFATAGAALDTREQRLRQFEHAARRLCTAAADEPIAIVLDDLHAADLPSLGFLHALVRRVARARLLVLGTFREIEARQVPEVGAALARIGREGDVIALERLSRDETLAWIRDAIPSATDADVDRVCAASDGNPLFVREVLRAARRLDVRRLPAGLEAVIEESVGRVPDETRELLATAAVLGREIALADVAALADVPLDEAEAHLHVSCDAGLLEPVPGRPEAFAFSHVLVRDRLYAQLAASRRAALHWRAGEQLVARDLARAAHHLYEGRAAGSVARVVEVARDAAQSALARFAFEDAARLAARGLELDPDDGAIVCALELIHAEAAIRLGDGDRGKALAVQAAARAAARGSPELLARAALVYGAELTTGIVDPTMVRLLREALAALPEGVDDALRACVMARLATALTPPSTDDLETIRELAERAMAIAQRLGDPRALLFVGYHTTNARYYHLRPSERDAMLDLVVQQATALGDELVLTHVASYLFSNLRERSARSAADDVLAAFADRLAQFPSANYLWRLPMLRATHALLEGDFEAAERLGHEGLALAERHRIIGGQMAWAQHRVALAQACGDPRSIAPIADRLLALLQPSPLVFTGFKVWILAAVGRAAEARALIPSLELDRAHFVSMMAVAEAAVLLDDRELAIGVHEVLAPTADHLYVFWGGPPCGTVIGPTSRLVALLAAYLGRTDEARRRYEQAIVDATRLGAVPLIELARAGLAKLGAPRAAVASAAAAETRARLARSGEHWKLEYQGRASILTARRGLDHLTRLIAEPNRELHVLELSAADADGERPRERGEPLLDAVAKAAYRARIDALRDTVERAEAARDTDVAERARGEIEAIAGELSRALGLGGRDRRTTTSADRARSAVTLAIRRAIEAIADVEPGLAGHLSSAVTTGAFCSYRPDPYAALIWDVAP
jgi:hypothetical protein